MEWGLKNRWDIHNWINLREIIEEWERILILGTNFPSSKFIRGRRKTNSCPVESFWCYIEVTTIPLNFLDRDCSWKGNGFLTTSFLKRMYFRLFVCILNPGGSNRTNGGLSTSVILLGSRTLTVASWEWLLIDWEWGMEWSTPLYDEKTTTTRWSNSRRIRYKEGMFSDDTCRIRVRLKRTDLWSLFSNVFSPISDE